MRRGENGEEDRALSEKLKHDPKERAENVMIVDLVRNDLGRIAEKGSVAVEELFGIHSFRTVHQMISTVSCKVRAGIHWTDVIRAAFPMGSMTGAPKVRAMELIEAYESMRRGVFSGSVGYVTPEGDFDLNVVIRSIMHHQKKQYTTMMVGGAITARSDPEKEEAECQLKVDALRRSLVLK